MPKRPVLRTTTSLHGASRRPWLPAPLYLPRSPPRCTSRGRRHKQQKKPALEVEDFLRGVRVPPLWSSLQIGKEDEMVVAFSAAGDLLDNPPSHGHRQRSRPAASGNRPVPLPSATSPTYSCPVDKALKSMEKEAERIFQGEWVLLREDEAASVRDTMYEQGEVVENELQHMTEQVKSIIQTMDAT